MLRERLGVHSSTSRKLQLSCWTVEANSESRRPLRVPENRVICNSSGRAYLRRHIVWAPVAKSVVYVRTEGKITMMGELSRHLAIQLIPSRHMVDHNNSWKGAGAKGTRKVRVDNVPVESLDRRGLCKHSFVHVCRVSMHNLCSRPMGGLRNR